MVGSFRFKGLGAGLPFAFRFLLIRSLSHSSSAVFPLYLVVKSAFSYGYFSSSAYELSEDGLSNTWIPCHTEGKSPFPFIKLFPLLAILVSFSTFNSVAVLGHLNEGLYAHLWDLFIFFTCL